MSTLLAVIRVHLHWDRRYLAVVPLLLLFWVGAGLLLRIDAMPLVIPTALFPGWRRMLGVNDEDRLFDLLPVTRRTVAAGRAVATLLCLLALLGVLAALMGLGKAVGLSQLLGVEPSGDWLVKVLAFSGIMLMVINVMDQLLLRFGFTRRLVLPVLLVLAGTLALVLALSAVALRLPATVTAWLTGAGPWVLFGLGILVHLACIPLNGRLQARQDHYPSWS